MGTDMDINFDEGLPQLEWSHDISCLLVSQLHLMQEPPLLLIYWTLKKSGYFKN
jgi:hypothetical protein